MEDNDDNNGTSEEQRPKEEPTIPTERTKEETNPSCAVSEDTNCRAIGVTDNTRMSQEKNELSASGDQTPKEEKKRNTETNEKQDELKMNRDGPISGFANELLQSLTDHCTEGNQRTSNGDEVHQEYDDSIEDFIYDIDEVLTENPFRKEEEDPEVREIRYENMKKSCTPLMHAAANGRRSWIKTLLAKGCSVHDTDSEGNTPMHFAARGGHDSCVKMLQGNGGKPNATNKEGHTPLHYAARWGHEKVTEILLRAGANSSSTDDRGMTPLHWAAAWNHCETIKVFLQHGADRRIKCTEGHTADDIAVMFRHKEASTILREEFPSIQEFLENSEKTQERTKTRRKRKKRPKAVNAAAALIVREMLALFNQNEMDSATRTIYEMGAGTHEPGEDLVQRARKLIMPD